MNMKKDNLGSKCLKGLAYCIQIIVCFVIGITGSIFLILDLGENDGFGMIPILFALLLIGNYLTIFIQILVHEGGHFIFGLISGYEFVSFRIFNMILISVSGKYKIKKLSIADTAGQCLMMPPKSDGYHYPYILYNLGGSIANVIISGISLLLLIVLPHIKFISFILLYLFFIGMVIGLMNGIPMNLRGNTNDGRNVVSLGKNKDARRAFWSQLYINGLNARGIRLRDMPNHLFEFSQDMDLNNHMICTWGVLRCMYLSDQNLIDETEKLINFLINRAPGILEAHKNVLLCGLLFHEIMGLGRLEEITTMFTLDLQKYVKASSASISTNRFLYAYELLVKKNEAKAKKHLQTFKKLIKTYPYPQVIEDELELIEKINEKKNEIEQLKSCTGEAQIEY
jgi:hypothetical protein